MGPAAEPGTANSADVQPPPASAPLGGPQAIQKTRYTHDALVDAILANPAVSQNELAVTFGYSPAWVSRVMSSDAFQAKFSERAAEMVDPVIRETIETRFKALVTRSLEILEEKLSKPTVSIPDNLALRALELSSRALGYGARPVAPAVTINVETHLEQLSTNLTRLMRSKREEYLHDPADTTPAIPAPAAP